MAFDSIFSLVMFVVEHVFGLLVAGVDGRCLLVLWSWIVECVV